MKTTHTNYWTAKSQAVLDLVRERLRQGPATTADLMNATGKSYGRARDYLMHMRLTGEVLQHKASVTSIVNGCSPAEWVLDPDYVPMTGPDDDEFDRFPRRVVVRKQWEPLHMRMPMDCLLFGVPAVLQGPTA